MFIFFVINKYFLLIITWIFLLNTFSIVFFFTMIPSECSKIENVFNKKNRGNCDIWEKINLKLRISEKI